MSEKEMNLLVTQLENLEQPSNEEQDLTRLRKALEILAQPSKVTQLYLEGTQDLNGLIEELKKWKQPSKVTQYPKRLREALKKLKDEWEGLKESQNKLKGLKESLKKLKEKWVGTKKKMKKGSANLRKLEDRFTKMIGIESLGCLSTKITKTTFFTIESIFSRCCSRFLWRLPRYRTAMGSVGSVVSVWS